MKVTRCLKLVATFYSFLTLSGGATAGFGLWSQISQKTSEVFKTVDGTTLITILSMESPMLIALGCIFALMGLIGFCGTLKKKSWMLLVFFVVVLILFILQVILAVFTLLPKFVKENAFSSLEVKFVESLQKEYGQEYSPVSSIWNETMTRLSCCGYKGYDDFTNSTFVKRNSEYPKQCCSKDSNSICGKQEAMNKKMKGCFHVLLDENIPISGALLFLIGILQIVALFGSLKVYRCLRRLPDLPDPF